MLPSGKKLPFAVMALTLCVAVVLGLGEIVIALTPLDRQLEANISARKQVERLSGAYRRPAFGLTPKKGAKQGNRIFTTNETFRASTVVMPKPKGAFRIFLLGDSVAWGMIGGVHMEPDDYNSYCLKRSLGHKLQKKVQAALPSRSVQLVNLGLPGCISEVVLERLKEVMQLDPDAFVINIGANEGNMEIVFSTLDPNRHKRSWLRRHFRLVDLLVTYSRPYEPPQEQPLLREKSLSENLIATLKLARNLGVPAYVCTPMSRKPDEFQSLVQVTRDAVREGGGILVDLEPAYSAAAERRNIRFESLFSDYVHPTAKGYDIMADTIAEAMLKQHRKRQRPSPTKQQAVGQSKSY